MNTIWKYGLEIADDVVIDMPAGARVLHVGIQVAPAPSWGEPDMACLWVLVDPDAPLERRMFKVVGTGHRHEGMDAWHYIGTFYMFGGIWHVFDPNPTVELALDLPRGSRQPVSVYEQAV